MALPKPQLNEDVLEYDEYQTDGINDLETTVTDHNSKIMQLLNWMGLVKDYVVDRDPNGNWEKWASGKFVQRGFHSSVVPINTTQGSGYRAAEAVNFGVPFLAGTVPHVMVSSANYTNIGVTSSTATTFQVVYTSFDINRQAGRFPYVAEGLWK